MRRILGSAIALVLFGGFALVGAPPAYAPPTDVCVGVGSLGTAAGLGINGATTTSFSFGLTPGVGTCLTTGLAGSGTLEGQCGLMLGSGATTDNHVFGLVVAGAVAVFLGHLDGVFAIVENPLDSGTCVNATATNFLLAGGVVKNKPCIVENTTTTWTPFGTAVVYTCV